MGTKYSSITVSGYNLHPPPDDGSTTSSNLVSWGGTYGTKTNLGDPLNAFAASVNSALVTALDVSVTTKSAPYTTVATDHIRPIEVTGTTLISLGDANAMGAGYQVPVVNVGAGTVTVGLITATDTLNGSVNGTITLPPGIGITATTNSTPNGYNVTSAAFGSVTGTGSVVLSTSPTLVSPALGTPSAIVLTNATGTAASLSAGHATTADSATTAGSATTAASATTASTATNLASGVGGTIPYQSAAGTTAMLANGNTGQIMQSAGGTSPPAWSVPAYPSASATARKIIVSDGTNFVASTETYAAPGTTGNVLTSDGTNWLSSAPAAGGISVGKAVALTSFIRW